jgi:hypothetical protein
LRGPPGANREDFRMMRATRRSSGSTLIETVAYLVVLALVLALLAVVFSGHGRGRTEPRGIKDSTYIRGIGQGLAVFAQNNGDRYPLPSQLDSADSTIPGGGRAKDTTANIYSILVYNGSISPDILVSPNEKSPSVRVSESYEYEAPKAAAVPAKALWDPAGIATGLGPGERGNVSYAHLQPAGGRLKAWGLTFSEAEPIVGLRGPEVSGAAASSEPEKDPRPIVSLANKNSVTLKILGDGTWWSGHVAFNDNHVEYLDKYVAHGKPYGPKSAAAAGKPDVLFYDEPEDAEHTNAYLGIWRTAGEDVSQWAGNWD